MKSRLLLLFLPLVFLFSSHTTPTKSSPKEDALATAWVDSVYNSLSQEERIGQFFMIRAHSDLGAEHIQSVKNQIQKYKVGGLCFFQGTPEKHAELINDYQSLSKVPLMVSIDGEWGLGMRMKSSTMSFPRQLMLGAIQDNRLIYEMGKQIAQDCRRIGIHVNFAPVADINNNAANPVIGTRSFGEDRYNVATKSYMYMKGLQDGKVMACAKHFPGHGDTDVDSHHDLPIIPHGLDRLDSIELYPFKVLIDQGIQSFMVAHLSMPALDDTKNLPTSLSKKVVTDLLKDKLGFKGLVYTDGMEMNGVTKHFKPGVPEAEALVAGADVLLVPDNITASVKAINKYLEEGKLDMQVLEGRIKKILLAKYNYDLHQYRPAKLTNIQLDLNSNAAKILKRKLIENALTLVSNEGNLVPLQKLGRTKIASLSIGASKGTTFQNSLDQYGKITHYQVGKNIDESKFQSLVSRLKKNDVVLVGLHNLNNSASKGYGIAKKTRTFLKALSEETNVIITVFGNPYSLKYFDSFPYVLAAYDEDDMTQDLAAQALFGVNAIKGRLPITASKKMKFNHGIITTPIVRLGYDLPERVGFDAAKLARIDSLMQKTIDTAATPGGVILVAKNGKIIHHKAYGHHTYNKKRPVNKSDIFDMASVTKICAATISIMKLVDEGKLDIDKPVSDYLPELKNTNKKDIIIKDMLSHISGLKSWIPFYRATVTKRKKPMPEFYQFGPNNGYETPVAQNLYMKTAYESEIWKQIYDSEVRPRGKYVYSDLGFYMMAQIVKQLTGKPIDKYVQETFYEPLGLSTATYNPLEKFSKNRIVPSEEDKYWRQQKVHGHVHDMGAAMLGGVSGHAGLFANANDIAIIMQMLLNEGYYGGKQYFSPETVKLFTQRHPLSTRRGIGFDMLELNPDRNPNLSTKASVNTFGHLGFTGTCTWADPDENLIYVFLSNRTYPTMKNRKLYSGDFRPRIQSLIYEALEK
ncbi:MAG: glycoside hydrolase family 3 N-terminal domain-containing protein [Bacteroidota bacterium]